MSKVQILVLVVCVTLFRITNTKTWKDYNLTVGPKKGESGRYIYKQSVGGFVHCHYCELKALRDSTYSFLQQPLCIKNYLGEKIEEKVLPQERKQSKYPICVKGEVPGCGLPPSVNKTKNHVWQCDPGYSNVKYSVYFSCALVCNVTDKVQWSYYCNESLQWDVEQSLPWQSCEVPVEIEEKSPLELYIFIGVGSFLVALIAVGIFFCVYRRNKRTGSAERLPVPNRGNNVENGHIIRNIHRAENMPMIPVVANVARPERVQVDDEVSDSQPSSSSGDGTDISAENQPLLPHGRPAMRDAGSGPDESDGLEEGAVGGVLPNEEADSGSQTDIQPNENTNAQQKGKPEIKIVLLDGKKSQQSVPLQNNYYSIQKGLNFAVVPNSPGGIIVRDFKVERKGEGAPFRGSAFQFWYVVMCATEDDAGYFIWTMRLDNDEIHQGIFEICIFEQDFFGEREEPVGQENDPEQVPSVRNPRNQYLPQLPINNAQSLVNDSLFKSQDSRAYKRNQDYILPRTQSPNACVVNADVHAERQLDTGLPQIPTYLPFGSSLDRDNRDSAVEIKDGDPPHQHNVRSEIFNPNGINHVNRNLRSGHMAESSGYGSQRSSEIDRERLNENRERLNERLNRDPALDINSLLTQISADTSQPRVMETIPENFQQSGLGEDVRFDPTGGAAVSQFTEYRSYSDDPEQVHRKEVVPSVMPQQALEHRPEEQQQHHEPMAAADDVDDSDDDDGDQLKILDYACHKKIGQHSDESDSAEGDTDSISERLISSPIQNPEIEGLPQSLDSGNVESLEVNEEIIPRRELEVADDSFEIEVLTNGGNSLHDNSTERQNETKF